MPKLFDDVKRVKKLKLKGPRVQRTKLLKRDSYNYFIKFPHCIIKDNVCTIICNKLIVS